MAIMTRSDLLLLALSLSVTELARATGIEPVLPAWGKYLKRSLIFDTYETA